MEDESTQPSTYPIETYERTKGSNNLSLEEELNIICLLRPCSRAAFDITEKVAKNTPNHVLHTGGGEIPQRYRKVIEMAEEVESRSRLSPVENGPEVTPDMTEIEMLDYSEHGVADIALKLDSPVTDMDMGFVFGRDPRKCDIVLQVDNKTAARISGMHFRIFLNNNGMIMLEDMSTNGTLVDNFLLKHKHPLPGNSVRRILQKGSVVAVFVKSDKTTARFIVDIPQRRDETAWRKCLEKYVETIKAARHQKLILLKNLGADKSPNSKTPNLLPVPSVIEEPQPAGNLFITAGTTPWNHGMRWNGGSRYNVIAKLGSGAFATVYKLVDLSSGDELAAKEIEKRRFMKNGVLDMKISTELDILKRLKHPHVIESFDHVDTTRDLYIMMELVPYGDLSIHVGTNEHLVDRDMRLIAKQMCQALAYLHDNGIAHRDIKPENIIKKRVKPLWIKLADFGLSKIITQDDHHTAYQTFCGTLLYCAPEVYPGFAFKRVGLPPDPRTTKPSPYSTAVDIWSLAAVLFHLLCGKPPYEASAANHGIHMLDTIFEERFPRAKFDDANVHPDWELFFENTLQLTAQQRWSARRLLKMPWLTLVLDVTPVNYEFQNPDKDFALEDESSDEDMSGTDQYEREFNDTVTSLKLSLSADPHSEDEDSASPDDEASIARLEEGLSPANGLRINVPPQRQAERAIFRKLDGRYNLRSQQSPNGPPTKPSRDDTSTNSKTSVPYFMAEDVPPLPEAKTKGRLFGEIAESGVFGSTNATPRIANAPYHIESRSTSNINSVHDTGFPRVNNNTKHQLNEEDSKSPSAASPKRPRTVTGQHQDYDPYVREVSCERAFVNDEQFPLLHQTAGAISFRSGTESEAYDTRAGDFPSSISSSRSRSLQNVFQGPPMIDSSRPSSPMGLQDLVGPALGILTPSTGSVPVEPVLITMPDTQYGRAPECTDRYPEPMDVRVPKSAFTILLHDPDGQNREGLDDWSKSRFYAIIGTRCSGHILINQIPMTRNKSKDEENTQMGLIQTGDVIEVFDRSNSHLRFHVRFYFGAAAQKRDTEKDPFKVMLGRSAIFQAIAEKEKSRLDLMPRA